MKFTFYFIKMFSFFKKYTIYNYDIRFITFIFRLKI